MRICWSSSTSAQYNLALEEWCLDRFAHDGPILLFYVDEPALIVGKNQNPWREAATGWARKHHIRIARRVSGGGTVYHDTGNLNFTLVVSRASYDQAEIFDRSRAALHSLGIAAELRDGNSLFAFGNKVSGTAFCYRGAAALHHGTVLVHSDLAQLRRALVPALPELETRAIASRPASVANVSDYAPALTMDRVATAFALHLGGSSTREPMPPPRDSEFTRLLARHSSWEWCFGHSPTFRCVIETSSNKLVLQVEKGLITDAVNQWCHDREEADTALIGCRFDAASLSARASDPETAVYLKNLDF